MSMDGPAGVPGYVRARQEPVARLDDSQLGASIETANASMQQLAAELAAARIRLATTSDQESDPTEGK